MKNKIVVYQIRDSQSELGILQGNSYFRSIFSMYALFKGNDYSLRLESNRNLHINVRLAQAYIFKFSSEKDT